MADIECDQHEEEQGIRGARLGATPSLNRSILFLYGATGWVYSVWNGTYCRLSHDTKRPTKFDIVCGTMQVP